MALINNLYVFVEKEDFDYEMTSASHPVEKGIEITDTVRRQPMKLSLSGKIVDTGAVKAAKILKDIQNLRTKGSLIEYRGSITATGLQIQKIQLSYSSEAWGAIGFSMELKEVRLAESSYTAPKATEPAPKANTAPTVTSLKVGDMVVFKGGPVYISSDATIRGATRGRSTCKILYINEASWAIHNYSLVSTDGGLVYGWVDKENIETIDGNPLGATTKAGMQQVQETSGTAVYHTVKSGDTVWALVNYTYKSLETTCQWVIDNNPSAFSRKGDASTLQVGKKLLMGYKK